MRILVTGGSGMVGRNIREAGADLDIVAPARADCDLTDAAATQAMIRDIAPDIVIHAAGRVGGIQANIASPVAFLETNLAIGRAVIMGAYHAEVPALINLGSTCIYPHAAPNPLREEAILTGPLEPTNEGYALAKITALRLCQFIRRERTDLHYKTLIPCNLYGRYDAFDPMRSHLIPAIIRKVDDAHATGRQTVEIWGDGTARREFMYARDLAEMVLKAAQSPHSLPDVMNVGLGHDHTINDFYAQVADVIGWNGRFTHDLDRPVGMKQKLCDTKRLRDWGWTAPTSLRDGLEHTYAFYKEHAS